MTKKLTKIIKITKNTLYRYLSLWSYKIIPSTRPLSFRYGLDRGTPIDRYYIENFLACNKDLIRGKCLEIKDNYYALKLGGVNVETCDILDIDISNKKATLYGDLRNLDNIADNTYDCIILTQVLQFIDDYSSAIRECKRILKPGGKILATVPSISRVDIRAGEECDFWRFTKAGAKYVFSSIFSPINVEIRSFGNAKAGSFFWLGYSVEDIDTRILDINDPNFPCLITIRLKNKIYEQSKTNTKKNLLFYIHDIRHHT